MEMYTKITSVFCSEQYCFGLFRVITIDWDSLHAFETEGILINTTYLNSGPMKEHKAPKPCTATKKKRFHFLIVLLAKHLYDNVNMLILSKRQLRVTMS